MILYTVKYKQNGFFKFWKTLKKVKGDGLLEDKVVRNNNGFDVITYKNIRWFVLEDETILEIPTHNCIFKFSKERHTSILERMKSESGQDLKLNKQ